jgi:hypothetical protein
MPKRGLNRASACLSIATVLFVAKLARAAEPAAAPPSDEAPPSGGIPRGMLVWHRWPLFDPYLSPRETIFTGGPLTERPVGTAFTSSGFEATVGRTIETRVRPFFVRLEVEYGFRVTGGSHWVLSLARYTYVGGLLLGPVELSGRFGTAVAEIHFGSGGFGLGFLSPRVGAAASVRAGPVRIGFLGFSELSWRWFGGPSALVHSALIEVGVGGAPDGLPAWYRVEK